MKRFILFFAATLFTIQFSQAQISKGNFMLGGGIGFSATNSSTSLENDGVEEDLGETSTTSLEFTPRIGYFAADNFAFGVQMDVDFTSADTEADETNTASSLLVGPFFRYYIPFGELGDKALFFELNSGFGGTQVTEGDVDVSTSVFGVGVGPGFTIFSNEFIGIEALALYNWVRSRSEIQEAVNLETVSSFDLSIGLQLYFSRLIAAR